MGAAEVGVLGQAQQDQGDRHLAVLLGPALAVVPGEGAPHGGGQLQPLGLLDLEAAVAGGGDDADTGRELGDGLRGSPGGVESCDRGHGNVLRLTQEPRPVPGL